MCEMQQRVSLITDTTSAVRRSLHLASGLGDYLPRQTAEAEMKPYFLRGDLGS